MRVISFDVGIKNLAYCIIDYTNTNDITKYDIIDWRVINLVSETDYKCCSILKEKKNSPKKVCGKKSMYAGKLKKDKYLFYCGTHKTNHDDVVDKVKTQINDRLTNTADGSPCSHMVRTGNICGKKSKFILNNCYLCKVHKEIKIKNIEKSHHIINVKKINSNKVQTSELAKILFECLDMVPNILDVNLVLIENQPIPLNPTMKTISTLILGYFIMKMQTVKNIENVLFMSPTNKLKVDNDKTIKIVKTISDSTSTNKTTKYKMTKKMGVEYTKILLNDNKKWIEYLEKQKKKDDLCDAFLQGYYYYNKHFISK